MENFFGCKRPNSNWRLSVQICGESYCRTRRPEKSWNKSQLEQLYYVPAFATVGVPQYAAAVVQEEPNRDYTGIKVVDYNIDADPLIEVDEGEELEEEPQGEVRMQFYGCSFMMVMVKEQCELPYKQPVLAVEAAAGSKLSSHPIDITDDD